METAVGPRQRPPIPQCAAPAAAKAIARIAWPARLAGSTSARAAILWLAIRRSHADVAVIHAAAESIASERGSIAMDYCSCGDRMARDLRRIQHRHRLWPGTGRGGTGSILRARRFSRIAFAAAWCCTLRGWAGRCLGRPQFPLASREKCRSSTYAWLVDLFFAGVIGYGLYLHFSGRVWCRSSARWRRPDAHLRAAFHDSRILADKKKMHLFATSAPACAIRASTS